MDRDGARPSELERSRKMKKNGDCIAEEELGVRSPFPYAEDGDENH